MLCLNVHHFPLQSLMPALMSLHKVYPRRNLPAEQLRNNQVLGILAEPAKMSAVPDTDTVRLLL